MPTRRRKYKLADIVAIIICIVIVVIVLLAITVKYHSCKKDIEKLKDDCVPISVNCVRLEKFMRKIKTIFKKDLEDFQNCDGNDGHLGGTTDPSFSYSFESIQYGLSALNSTECWEETNSNQIADEKRNYFSGHPWAASLVYDDGTQSTINCSGTLITDRYVLTAAYCIYLKIEQLNSVLVGNSNTSRQEIGIKNAVYHHAYNPSQFANDIGLIRLNRSAILNAHVQLICLSIPPGETPLDQPTTETHEVLLIDENTSTPKTETVYFTDKDSCQAIYQLLPITDNLICAISDVNVIGTKSYGGPLFRSSRHRRDVQDGILLAANIEINSAKSAVIFTKVNLYLRWIAGNIQPDIPDAN